MGSLELRIPPVIVVLVAAGLMWLAASLLPALAQEFPGRQALALALIACGVAVALAGVVQFRRAATTVNPMTPEASSSLVVAGIYRRTRNPMYLGMLLALAAWAAFLASLAAALILPLFVAYMNRFQIAPEERALAARFGRQFDDYRGTVRSWL